MNHILIKEEDLQIGYLSKEDERYQHITKILKLKEGDHFRLGVLETSKGLATITSIRANKLFYDYQPLEWVEDLLPITIILSATRPLVMKRLLKDITAFGVKNIFVLHTQNSEMSYMDSHLWKKDEWKKSIYEGLSLSQSIKEPHLQRFYHINDLFDQLCDEQKLVADATASESLFAKTVHGAFSLAIGPERGFTQSEMKAFWDNGFLSGHLGKRTLRSEVANLMSLALVSYAAGIL